MSCAHELSRAHQKRFNFYTIYLSLGVSIVENVKKQINLTMVPSAKLLTFDPLFEK